MNIDISLLLNDEQAASLQKRANEAGLTAKNYLLRSLNAEIASYVEADFNAAVERLRIGAKSLPFEQRITLIEQVEQVIQAP